MSIRLRIKVMPVAPTQGSADWVFNSNTVSSIPCLITSTTSNEEVPKVRLSFVAYSKTGLAGITYSVWKFDYDKDTYKKIGEGLKYGVVVKNQQVTEYKARVIFDSQNGSPIELDLSDTSLGVVIKLIVKVFARDNTVMTTESHFCNICVEDLGNLGLGGH